MGLGKLIPNIRIKSQKRELKAKGTVMLYNPTKHCLSLKQYFSAIVASKQGLVGLCCESFARTVS